MCGIAGVLRFSNDGAFDATLTARSLAAALAHRGPDGEGHHVSPDRRALLVHRRLAIIDLSPAAAQPMASSDGRHHLVFNGEVFNYRELRAALEARGETFRTGSDTEVLLRLLARDGPEALTRVRGMFALAWWDEDARALLVARDRFGIKPLYVAPGPTRVAFASELQALRKSSLASPDPSPDGVLAYLRWGSIPAPLTWVRGVDSLEPGTWRRWEAGGGTSTGTFADVRLAFVDRPACAREDLRQRVRGAVEDSVRAHLVADVPVGVFLSGGIDSSAIVAAARAATGADLRTLTVAFDDPRSEAPIAREVAARFGTRHEVLHLDAAAVVRELPSILLRLDQPTGDAINSYFVAKAAAGTGLKAVLSGAGGDELFGGYPSFRRLPRALGAARTWRPLLPLAAPLVAAGLPTRLKARWAHFVSTSGDVREAYRAQRGFFMPRELDRIAGEALRASASRVDEVEARLLRAAGHERVVASVARLELRQYLGSQLLRDIDAMSIAHALEVRVPFVDHELLAEVWPDAGAHPDLLAGKQLLHGTLAKPLPAAVTGRPKQGFTLPFDRWMAGELHEFVRTGLDEVSRDGWVAPGAVQETWDSWRARRTHWSRPWTLAVLGRFLSDARATHVTAA